MMKECELQPRLQPHSKRSRLLILAGCVPLLSQCAGELGTTQSAQLPTPYATVPIHAGDIHHEPPLTINPRLPDLSQQAIQPDSGVKGRPRQIEAYINTDDGSDMQAVEQGIDHVPEQLIVVDPRVHDTNGQPCQALYVVSQNDVNVVTVYPYGAGSAQAFERFAKDPGGIVHQEDLGQIPGVEVPIVIATPTLKALHAAAQQVIKFADIGCSVYYTDIVATQAASSDATISESRLNSTITSRLTSFEPN